MRDLLNKARGLKNKSAEVKDAEAYLLRREDMLESSPFEDSVRGRSEHASRFGEALSGIHDFRPTSLNDRPRPPLRDIPPKPTAEGAPEIVAEVGLREYFNMVSL